MPSGETIVHIATDDLHLTELNGEEIGHTITHTPVSPEVLDRSETNLVNESGLIPDFAEGYADWKKESGCAFNADGCTVAKGGDSARKRFSAWDGRRADPIGDVQAEYSPVIPSIGGYVIVSGGGASGPTAGAGCASIPASAAYAPSCANFKASAPAR